MLSFVYSENVAFDTAPREDSGQSAHSGSLFRIFNERIKTRLYNFDPLKSHFYILKFWFTGEYITFFFYLAEKHRLWYSLLTSTHNLCFEQKYGKYQNFFI